MRRAPSRKILRYLPKTPVTEAEDEDTCTSQCYYKMTQPTDDALLIGNRKVRGDNLDYLIRALIRLSEEVTTKRHGFDKELIPPRGGYHGAHPGTERDRRLKESG